MNDIVYVVVVETYWDNYGSTKYLAGVFTDKDTAEKEAGKYVWYEKVQDSDERYRNVMGRAMECKLNEAADLFQNIEFAFNSDPYEEGLPKDFVWDEEKHYWNNRCRCIGGYVE